jgi:hypothetical protein
LIIPNLLLQCFTITATSTSVGVTCPAEQTVDVDVYANPVITAAPDRITTICIGESVDLIAKGVSTYEWHTSATGETITVTPQFQTNYIIT